MKLIASVTIDIYEDRVEAWSQERENLTKEQKGRVKELLKKVKAATTPQQLNLISTEKPNPCPDSLTLSDTMKIGT